MTTHRLITPWPVSADSFVMWCGKRTNELPADAMAAFDVGVVDCHACATAMRAAAAQLLVDVPRLRPEVGR
jgi:hypothetical protein